jgi:UDP-2-acetamido-3-amino-2,3-dideoxy-glucuronate N-acetyltransferase
MVQIGLIGGGRWGQNLIREFNELGALRKICEIDKELIEKYKKMYPKIRMTSKWVNLLADKKVTAVCVSLPTIYHYKYAKEALENDKDVFVEKPITLCQKEAEELIKLAKEKNKILMVGHILQYHPTITKIKELINNNRIGKIRNIASNRTKIYDNNVKREESVLWSFTPHDISVCLSLCNNELPSQVTSTGVSCVTPDIEDITNCNLKYDNGIYVNIYTSWLHPYKEQKLVINGEKGAIEFNDLESQNHKITLYKYGKAKRIKYSNKNSPLYEECSHFIKCCQDRIQPITNGEEGLRVIKVLSSLDKSLKSSTLIKLEDCKYYAHPTAIIDDGAEIGDGTKIWHYSHITSDAVIGKNCSIGQNAYIAGILGDNCKVQNNVSLYIGNVCEDYVFLGPSCVLTNDLNPRSEYSKNGNYKKTLIKRGATIGANSTIVCDNVVGEYALIGAGSVITKDVEPYTVVAGNPAKKIGMVNEIGNKTNIEPHIIIDK